MSALTLKELEKLAYKLAKKTGSVTDARATLIALFGSPRK